MSIEFREFHDSDLDQIVELYISSFADHVTNRQIQKLKSGSTSILDWQYSDQQSTRVVALIHGKIIAHCGGMHRKMIYHSEELDAIESVDLMVHPDNRSIGIGTQLDKFHTELVSKKNNSVLFRFPNKKNESRIKMYAPNYTHFDLPVISREVIEFYPRSCINKVEKFGPEVDHLFEKQKNKLGLTTVRSHQYLNWRFIDNPINNYNIFVQQSYEKIDGYAVLKIYDDSIQKKGHIIDYLADSDSTLTNLVMFAQNYLTEQDIRNVTTYLTPNNCYSQIFKNFKFEQINDRSFFIDVLNRKFQNLNQSDEVNRAHMTMMDHNVF